MTDEEQARDRAGAASGDPLTPRAPAPDAPPACGQCSREARAKALLEHYVVYRDYLKHEDNLINNRLNWNLTVHGFLLAAYGYQLQKLLEPRPAEQQSGALLFLSCATLLVVPVAGALISEYGTRSIDAALAAIDSLTTAWDQLYAYRAPSPRCAELELPRLSGGGSVFAERRGSSAPKQTIRTLRGVWIALVFASFGYVVFSLPQQIERARTAAAPRPSSSARQIAPAATE